MTPAEAAAQLRHVADLFCTPEINQAAIMGAEALEAFDKLTSTAKRIESERADRKEQTT
jgi:hypothetical protein